MGQNVKNKTCGYLGGPGGNGDPYVNIAYMGHNVKNVHFWLFGGSGWPLYYQTGPILLPRHPLINIHIPHGSNPIRIC